MNFMSVICLEYFDLKPPENFNVNKTAVTQKYFQKIEINQPTISKPWL